MLAIDEALLESAVCRSASKSSSNCGWPAASERKIHISLVEAEQVAWEMGGTLSRLSYRWRSRFDWGALVRLADKFLAGLFDRPGPRHDWNPGDQSIAACRQSLENLEV